MTDIKEFVKKMIEKQDSFDDNVAFEMFFNDLKVQKIISEKDKKICMKLAFLVGCEWIAQHYE